MTHPRSSSVTLPAGADAAAHQAFVMLRTVFTVAPIAFGLDKFAGLLTDWERYLAPWVDHLLPGTAHQAMLVVGAVEVLAGVLVAVRPAVGGLVVAAWLCGIVVNLVTMGEYLDIALRDVGLMVGALALARLATAVTSPGSAREEHR